MSPPFAFLKKSFLILLLVLCTSCAVVPRVSSWDSPRQFKKAQVFNAGLQAGSQIGYITTASDRESGTMSFNQRIGDGTFTLSVQVSDSAGAVSVRTTGALGGDLAIAGLHEEVIRNFHIMLFRNLKINDPAELKNLRITEFK